MDALALGSAGACFLRIPELRKPLLGQTKRLLTIALTLFVLGIPLTNVYDRTRWAGETLGYSVLAVTCAVFVTVVAMFATTPPSRVASVVGCAPLRSLGKYSYAMYVFHGLLHKLVGEPWLVARYGTPCLLLPLVLRTRAAARQLPAGLLQLRAIRTTLS
jgi:peptidoglycan/LPS O-acetylase OafA/YrhL